MRMKLHLDTKIGDTVILPIYEIDYATATQTAGYNEISNGTFGDGSKYNKFSVSNNQGAITDFLSASVPRVMEDNNTNCLLPYRLRYTSELGGHYYPITWFDEGAFTKLETAPTDWSLAYKYLKYQTIESTRHLFSPHDAGNTSGSVDQFSANNCYTDNNRTFIRRYVTESNAYFACGQGYGYGGYTSYAIIYPLCLSIGTPTTGSPYNPSNGFYFHDTAGNAANIGIIFTGSNTHDIPQGSTLWSTGYARTPIFIHYVKNNVDYYGVAVIEWSSFDSDNFPTSINVVGISDPFWGASIISGGESGAGSWGSNNQPIISDGTFSGRSDSVTRDPTDPHSNAKQYSDIADDRVGVFGQYGGYHIYAIPHWSSTNTDFKTIMEILYGTDFWSRWVNSNFNPLSAIISLGMLPYDFANSAHIGYYQPLVVAGFNLSSQFPGDPPNFPCLNSVSRVAFDAIDINKYFGGYADFAPYTQAILHLPFVGDINLDVNSIAHGKLGVEYLCDVANGNVVAWIWTEDYTGENSQYITCAKGNCMYSLPLFSMSQDGSGLGRIFLGITSAVVGAALASPTAALGGVAAAYTGAEKMAGISGTRSGNLDGNISNISPKEVWLELIRPKWCENMFYQKLRGIPSEMSHYINDCGQETDSSGNPVPTGIAYDGYLKISEIELDGVNATDAEKEEIEALLKAGVYIRGTEL